jgi:hypothetical protein
MNRTTFEMLAKWIAKETGTRIVFDTEIKGAAADIKTNEIFMPYDLKERNILAALALLIHEAAHLKHSKIIPTDLVKGVVSRNILNVMEDIRIDNKNFGVLDNIRDFYERLLRDHVRAKKDEIAQEDLLTRCMINSILVLEGFEPLPDQEAIEFNARNDVDSIIGSGQWAIEAKNWDEVKGCIDKIIKLFKVTPEQDYEMPTGMRLIGIGKEDKNGKEKGGVDVLGDVDKFMRPGSAWDKGDGIQGPSRDIFGEAAFDDLTKQGFKELLNIKEKRIINEGMQLNTDAIPSFLTGDIDELFQQDEVIKIKKSKIVFCLDSSGSMASELMDKQTREAVLVKTVRSMINILEEAKETEGLNINWDVWGFDTDARKLDPDRWETEYTTMGGGTNLLYAFLKVQEDILNDQEIDGNKLIILITDGEVCPEEVSDLKDHIIRHGAEVRCMIVGIGARLNGAFTKTIVGDSNILGEEHADSIIMDTIKTMLE